MRDRRTVRRGRRRRDRVPGLFRSAHRRSPEPGGSELPTPQIPSCPIRPNARLSRGLAVRRTESSPEFHSARKAVMITFEDVSKVYPDGTVAVDNLTITAPNGKITTLVGPSGCGKTTSMRMINRLIEPTSGSITLDGTDTQTLYKVALRRRIGYVIQNACLVTHRA